MRHTRSLRLVLLACAIATTMIAGAKSVTTAAAGVDPLIARDLTHDGPVFRATHYVSHGDQDVDLAASGGSGALDYRIVEPPTSGGERVGTVAVSGDDATIAIDPTAEPGPARFRYRAVDDEGRLSDVATVRFDIANQPPQTEDMSLSTRRNTPLGLWPYARDAEDGGPFPWRRDGNRITYERPEHGTVRPAFEGGHAESNLETAGHQAIYVPDRGYTGPDAFEYTFTDSEGGTSTGSIAVDVTEPPRPAGRRYVRDVLYRCPVRMRVDSDGDADPAGRYDEHVTRIVSRTLGGDLLLRARVSGRSKAMPGGSYGLTPIRLGLTLSPGAADVLAGRDVAGRTIDLTRAGLGQRRLRTSVSADLRVDETATGETYDLALTGLESARVPLDRPSQEHGTTLTAEGRAGDLTAPRRGSVAVSMPRRFDLDAALEPGLSGAIGSVGMRCHALSGQGRVLLRLPAR